MKRPIPTVIPDIHSLTSMRGWGLGERKNWGMFKTTTMIMLLLTTMIIHVITIISMILIRAFLCGYAQVGLYGVPGNENDESTVCMSVLY